MDRIVAPGAVCRFPRPVLVGLAGAILLAASGCTSGSGGSGVQPIPDPSTLLPYAGEWVLQEVRAPEDGLRFVATGGRGFRSTVVQELGKRLEFRPERLRLEWSESSLRVAGDGPGLPFSLPMDGTGVEIRDEEGQVIGSLTLTWGDGAPVVRQTLSSVGWVSDHYRLTDAETLTVTRTAGMQDNARRDREAMGAVDLVFARAAGSGS